MSLDNFENFLAKIDTLQEKTKQVYKQDIKDFLAFVKVEINEIKESDIHGFLEYLSTCGISYSYGIRKLSALRLFFLFLNKSYIFESINFDICRFPLFCTKNIILKIFEQYRLCDDYISLRNKLILILTYNYNITIEQLATLTFEFFQNNYLQEKDQELIEAYKKLLFLKFPYCRGYNYLFPVQYGKEVKTISVKAVWSILKKIFQQSNNSLTQLSLNNKEYFYVDMEQKVHYKQKHPRGGL